MTLYTRRGAHVCVWTALILLVLLDGTDRPVRADQVGLAVTDLQRDAAVDFEDEILPVLRKNCVACHNATEAENDLILQTPQTILTGGIEGPAVVAGQAAESLLFNVSAHRVEPFMPPEDNDVGANNLTAAELGILKLWIDQGARGLLKKAAARIQWKPIPVHVQPVYAVAISPCGGYVAATRANQISVYHLASEKEVTRLTDPAVASTDRPGSSHAAHLDLVQSLAFSSDGLWLASGGFRTVKLWRRALPTQELDVDFDTAEVTAVAASRDATRVAVGTTDGQVVLIDGSSRRVLKTFEARGCTIRCLAFSQDDLRLACGAEDKVIRIYDVAAGSELGRVPTPETPLAVAWVANDSQIATGGAERAIQLRPVPTREGSEEEIEPQACLKGHDAAVTTLTGIPGKGQLVSGSQDGTLRVWEVPSGRLLHRIDHGAPLTGTAVRHDGSRIASIGESGVARLWDASNGQLKTELRGNLRERRHGIELLHALELQKLHVANAKSDLDAATKSKVDEDENVKQAEEELTKAEETLRQKTAAADKAVAAKKSADKVLAAAKTELSQLQVQQSKVDEKRQGAGDQDGAAAQDAKQVDDKILQQAMERVKEAEGNLKPLGQALDKANVEMSDAQRDLESTSQLVQRDRDAAQVAAKAIAPFEIALRQAEEKLKTRQHDYNRQQQAASTASAPPSSIAFSLDGSEVAVASEDGAIHTFGGDDGSPIEALATSPHRIVALTYLPNGQLLVAGRDKALTIRPTLPRWQLDKTIGSPDSPNELVGRVTALDFSPDGKMLATGTGEVSRNGQLKLWNVAEGRLVREIQKPHEDTVLGVAFSPDGKQIASCGADRLMKVFDVDSGSSDRVFEGHTDHVLGVSWQADSRQLATCGADRVIKIWDARTGEQQRTITGFTKEITAIRFMGLDRRIVVSCGNNLITSRKVDGGGGPQFSGVSAFMYTVDCNADGKIVVAGGHDGIVRAWNDQGKPVVTFMPPTASSVSGRSATN